MAYIRDASDNLFDDQGKSVGRVNHDNTVTDSYHNRGYINNDDRYIDEFGRDQGWVTSGSSSGSSSSSDGWEGALGLAVLGILTLGMSSLIRWIWANPKRKKVATIIFFIWLAGFVCVSLVFLLGQLIGGYLRW